MYLKKNDIQKKLGHGPSKKAFTLIELLIASSILMMIIAMSLSIFFNITHLNTYIELTDKLQSESRYALEKIVREIQGTTIDYPEYYNYYVLSGSGQQFAPDENIGSNYSVYGARFYNPGEDANNLGAQGLNTGGLDTDDLGTWCQFTLSGKVARINEPYCQTSPPKPSLEATEDFVTGTNPYTGSTPTLPNQASAICDSTSEMFTNSKRDCSFTNATDAHELDTLFLISGDGTTKTIITREPWGPSSSVTDGYVISMLKMNGMDEDMDGVKEVWTCDERFLCSGNPPEYNQPAKTASGNAIADITTPKNKAYLYQNFAPISPYHLNITDLRFYVAPLEDPHKAYDEFPEQIHPYVTIVMTAELIDPRVSELPSSQRSITLQTTVSTSVYGEIESYLGTE